MKDNPAAPGSNAMLLFRSLLTQDIESWQDEYYRIKIFSEDGKKYADIEIPYRRGTIWISDIKARVIRPDGTVVNFDGKVFDKMIAKYRGFQMAAKTFTLPDIQVGSIIEYRFRKNWDRNLLLSTTWILHSDLFTRRAEFYVKPYDQYYPNWRTVRSPGNVTPTKMKGGTYGMILENIPAFKQEPFSPPADELKGRIDIFYTTSDRGDETAAKYWNRIGKAWHTNAEGFIGNRKGIQAAVATLVTPADSPDAQLRKIYARAQQVRNISFEQLRTEKEEKREKLKDNKSVEDVWKNGYGYSYEINRLFVALARAAGFESTVVRVSTRNRYFFNPNIFDSDQLNDEVAWVNAGGKDYFLDPGTAFCPFGLLAWENTGVQGIKLSKDGGTFVTTPLPGSSNAVTQRIANLKLTEDGSLEGKLEVYYTGLDGLRRRLENFEEDESGRRKEIEDEIKGWLPGGATLKIESITGWDSTNDPLLVNASIRIPGLAAATGRRILLPVGIFQTQTRNPFQSSDRLHPVYFRHPFQVSDNITIDLPPGIEVETLPTPRNSQREFAVFLSRYESAGKSLRFQRQMAVDGILFQPHQYALLRAFYDAARTADEEQAILRTAPVAEKE